MAETLGSLCDKLTIIKLKQWHSDDPNRLDSLERQSNGIQLEIDEFLRAALSGEIPVEKLCFASNKVFKREGNDVPTVSGSLGEVVAKLSSVNTDLWHEQEKVYEFERVPPDQKDVVVKRLAVLNLERNQCIDRIDRLLQEAIALRQSNH